MSVLSFPTLSTNPSHIKWKRVKNPNVQNPSQSNVLGKSGRKPFRVQFTITYPPITATDKSSLSSFEQEDTKFGCLQFQWTNVLTEQTFHCRLLKPIEFEAIRGHGTFYKCRIELEGRGTFGYGDFGAGYFGY